MSQVLFKTKTFWYGIALTFCIATLSYFLAKLPFLMILGQLVTAILIGIIIRALFPVPDKWFTGIQFSNKVILRAGIILLGFRLNLVDIYDAGWRVFLIAALCLSFGITVVYFLAKLFGVDKKLAILVACGTGICGAAAVVAISPQVKADNNQTAVAATIIALLGTIFTIVYTLIYPILPLGPDGYGIFAGATLHEIAHVIAAADPGGTGAVDMAVIVKLTRVALLVPVCFVVAKMVNAGTNNRFSWRTSCTVVYFRLFSYECYQQFRHHSRVHYKFPRCLCLFPYCYVNGRTWIKCPLTFFWKNGWKTFCSSLYRFYFTFRFWANFSTFVSFSRLSYPRQLKL